MASKKRKREYGWYWVREDAQRSWRVAEWTKFGWYVCGYECDLGDDYFAIIGPRILPPKGKR